MTGLSLAAVAGVAGALFGYVAGRARLGHRLVGWADAQTSRPWWHPVLLVAAPIVVAAVIAMCLFRPRRTAGSLRTWSPEDTLTVPVPTYDPHRAGHRWSRRQYP